MNFLVGDVNQTLKLVSCNKLQLLQTKKIKTNLKQGIHAFCLDDYEDMLMTFITNLIEINGHHMGINLEADYFALGLCSLIIGCIMVIASLSMINK